MGNLYCLPLCHGFYTVYFEIINKVNEYDVYFLRSKITGEIVPETGL